MGSGSSAFTEEELHVYKELTYLTQAEIVRVYKKFCECQLPKKPDKNRRISVRRLGTLPELAQNPFIDRLAALFSSEGENKGISFEDLLDMMSILSPQAPVERKAYYAFRMYDIDGDNQISREDLHEVIERLSKNRETGDSLLRQHEINEIVESILREADIDHDGVLSHQEFEHMILKTPDFASSFTIRL